VSADISVSEKSIEEISLQVTGPRQLTLPAALFSTRPSSCGDIPISEKSLEEISLQIRKTSIDGVGLFSTRLSLFHNVPGDIPISEKSVEEIFIQIRMPSSIHRTVYPLLNTGSLIHLRSMQPHYFQIGDNCN
jgi:hypothetical protein